MDWSPQREQGVFTHNLACAAGFNPGDKMGANDGSALPGLAIRTL
jgi:hypothetical protein